MLSWEDNHSVFISYITDYPMNFTGNNPTKKSCRMGEGLAGYFLLDAHTEEHSWGFSSCTSWLSLALLSLGTIFSVCVRNCLNIVLYDTNTMETMVYLLLGV